MEREETREDYRHFATLGTRWLDNDVYGHVNNVQYYSFFDTAVNRFLIERRVLDIHQGEVIGLVVETQCNFFASAAFPDDIEAGIRVARIGNSSVRYEVGLFTAGRENPIARGHFIHVYVDRTSRKPVSLPPDLRETLESIRIDA